MKKDMGMFLWLISEVALVPDRPLIVKEVFALRVPITWHFQFRRFRKVIFNRTGIARLGLLIQEPAILFLFMMKAEQPGEIRIDNRTPFAIERRCWAPVRTRQHERGMRAPRL